MARLITRSNRIVGMEIIVMSIVSMCYNYRVHDNVGTMEERLREVSEAAFPPSFSEESLAVIKTVMHYLVKVRCLALTPYLSSFVLMVLAVIRHGPAYMLLFWLVFWLIQSFLPDVVALLTASWMCGNMDSGCIEFFILKFFVISSSLYLAASVLMLYWDLGTFPDNPSEWITMSEVQQEELEKGYESFLEFQIVKKLQHKVFQARRRSLDSLTDAVLNDSDSIDSILTRWEQGSDTQNLRERALKFLSPLTDLKYHPSTPPSDQIAITEKKRDHAAQVRTLSRKWINKHERKILDGEHGRNKIEKNKISSQ